MCEHVKWRYKNVQKFAHGHKAESDKTMICNSRTQLVNATLNTTHTQRFMNEYVIP